MSTTAGEAHPRVFLSYRRNDTSAATGRLSDVLRSRLGTSNVFLDIDEIALGDNVREAIDNAIRSADVVLVLIGSRWLEGSRLEYDYDYVRMEIEAAFDSGRTIIPVLVDEAQMPAAAELPESIREINLKNAARLSWDTFGPDVERLIAAVESTVSIRIIEPSESQNLSSAFAQPRSLIFVSYAHEDEMWLNRVKVHLKPLTRRGRLELWDDNQIRVGEEWRNEIRKALATCVAAVLLVSADFMASDFIFNDELPPLLDAARTRGVRVLSILVSSSNFERSELAKFQALNPPSEPLDLLTSLGYSLAGGVEAGGGVGIR